MHFALPFVIFGFHASIAGFRNQRGQRWQLRFRVCVIKFIDAHKPPRLGNIGHDLFGRYLKSVRTPKPGQTRQGRLMITVKPSRIIGFKPGRNIVQMESRMGHYAEVLFASFARPSGQPSDGRDDKDEPEKHIEIVDIGNHCCLPVHLSVEHNQ
jgi:hypothetical protein